MDMQFNPPPCLALPAADGHGIYHQDRRPHMRAYWARGDADLREAQRLRRRVFGEGLGVRTEPGGETPHRRDVDVLDPVCEHLIVRAYDDERKPAGRVVATCRVLTPDAALHAGGLASDDAFDLSQLDTLRPQLAEVSRACVDPRDRQGTAFMMLWARLAEFMHDNRLRWLLASHDVPMRDGGHAAASLWHEIASTRRQHLPAERQVRPRRPLPIERLGQDLRVEPSPIVLGYLRCGATLVGPPAWNAQLGHAALPFLMDLRNPPPRARWADIDD